jgi:uncharacterized protein (DUF433 family)
MQWSNKLQPNTIFKQRKTIMAGVKATLSLKERLDIRKVIAPNGCHLWTGHTLNGYGKLRFKGDRIYTHRAAYQLAHGDLTNELCVCHTCDNPICINPEHLFLGSRAINNADKVAKNRQAKGVNHGLKGSAHPLARLTEIAVLAIRAAYKAGEKQKKLAETYLVSRSQISQIVNKKKWKLI